MFQGSEPQTSFGLTFSLHCVTMGGKEGHSSPFIPYTPFKILGMNDDKFKVIDLI